MNRFKLQKGVSQQFNGLKNSEKVQPTSSNNCRTDLPFYLFPKTLNACALYKRFSILGTGIGRWRGRDVCGRFQRERGSELVSVSSQRGVAAKGFERRTSTRRSCIIVLLRAAQLKQPIQPGIYTEAYNAELVFLRNSEQMRQSTRSQGSCVYVRIL